MSHIAILAAAGIDQAYAEKILLADQIGKNPAYTEEVFLSHVQAAAENKNYLPFLERMGSNPATRGMFSYILIGGVQGVYAMLGEMAGAGLIDKEKVAASAKIKTASKKSDKPYFRVIWDSLGQEAYDFVEEKFAQNLPNYRKKFPEMGAQVVDLKSFLWDCGKSTLNTTTAHMHVEQTKYEAAVGFGFRLDAHTKSRNGGWDPDAGELTDKGIERMEKLAKKEAGEIVDEDEDSADDENSSDDES